MILKSIALENIRSYTFQKIEFPQGSILLSGDIGSGKSTILLAIEFALFGILGKQLSGNALLRNGSNVGSVTLEFNIDKTEVLIKRVLKRGKDSVGQAAGYIVIDGVKKEATPVELKAEILKILGYPSSLITKSKNHVFRYTVYTPQEEMQKILLEDENERVDTLGKVFGIDKYKVIRENTLKILRELKSEAKFLESKISDLPIKEEQKEDKLKEIKKAEEGLLIILPKIDMMKEQSDKKRRMLNQIEEKMQQLNKLKQELRVKSNELQTGKNQSKQNGNQIQILDTQVKNLKTEVGDKKAEDVSKELQEKQSSLILEEKKSREVVDSISMLKAKHHQSGEVKEKILNLDHCPMCEQQVSHEHKRGITHREDEKIEKLKEQMQDYASRVSIIDKEMIKLKQIIEVLRKQESEFSVLNLKRRYIIEKEKSIKDLQEVNLRLEKEQGEIKIIIGDVEQQISKFEDIEDHYQQLKLELDSVLRDERNFAVEKTRIETGKKNMEEMLLLIDSEILSRLTDKEKLKKMKGMQMWMEDGFIPLMTTMEKHVMASIYSEFNELFQQWFSLLIEDASLNVRLDDRFTPVIDQNGYETAINHLSGGERTSAALAYRLALHKVVNDLMPHINTKDLIILDEPTDGFSDEQLDRVREVLNELSTHQTIIVSHESKIESFVDHVIRIEKHEHVSKVVLI